jgi:LysR family carnitine catabolism transcriptional activator
LRDPVVERALGVLTLPGGELSAAAQALFDVLKEENLGQRVAMS